MPRKARIPDLETIRIALRAGDGIQTRAANVLGVPRTTLQKWLERPELQELVTYAAKLRTDLAPPEQGRPFTMDASRTRAKVARAWRASGYRLTKAARALGIPRTSLRHLLYRYDLPNLPAPGRPEQNKSRK
jgi:DNA-binding protein Fis